MENIFSGTTCIVTGGGSGIGAALVARLIEKGATVCVVGRSPDYTGPAHRYVSADMSDEQQAKNAFEQVVRAFGQVSYVFNNAGIFMGGEIRDTPLKNWHTVIDNNIYAVFHGTQLAYQQMITQGSGHIVNVASTAGLVPIPAMGIYGSSKYAIVGLSRALRNEAATLGVRVSVACPTIVDTPLYDTALYNNMTKKRLLRKRSTLQSADTAARKILDGVQKNRATIHTSFTTHALWLFYRLAPGLYDRAAKSLVRTYRRRYRKR